jgi:hypothetical protein
MRKAEELILAQTDLRSIFRSFFEDFVADFVVQDWKRLHTRDNPFRFRSQIRNLGQDMLDDELLLGDLAAAYVREGRSRDAAQARTEIITEIRGILRVFDAVDEHIDLIEDTNTRIERRITNIVRFMDRIAETSSERISMALKLFGGAALDHDDDIDVPTRFLDAALPISGRHLFQNSNRRQEVIPQKLRRPPPDPAVKAFRDAQVAFQQRTFVTVSKVAAYLDRVMAGRDCAAAADLPVESLDDFFIFERLRDLPVLGGGALNDSYAVERTGLTLENDWIICPDFFITRVPKENTHA